MTHDEATHYYVITDGEMFACFNASWSYDVRQAVTFEIREAAEDVARMKREYNGDDNIGVITLAEALER